MDDVDFGASGTVATLTDAGVVVSYCIVTDGDAGGSDPSVPPRIAVRTGVIPSARYLQSLGLAE